MTLSLGSLPHRTPSTTSTAFALSVAAHLAVLFGVGALSVQAPRPMAFDPIEVSLVSESAPMPVMNSAPRLAPVRASIAAPVMTQAPVSTSATTAEEPASAQTEPASEPDSSKSEEALVKSRYDVRSLNNPKPPYPLTARRRGMEGSVLLRAYVREDGQCIEVQLKHSSGYDLLDNAALQTVKRWRFVPASRGGTAVASWVEIPVSFQLRNEPVALNATAY